MTLKPWHRVVEPREDLREGRPLDASEFAVHLDKVREGTAPDVYRDPKRFFDRTYMTANLLGLGAEAIRRLSGIKTETSAIFNMATQFGGGKTHALTMLYHLATSGRKAEGWNGVDRLMTKAGVDKVPQAAVATLWAPSSTRSLVGAAAMAPRTVRPLGARSPGSWVGRNPSPSWPSTSGR